MKLKIDVKAFILVLSPFVLLFIFGIVSINWLPKSEYANCVQVVDEAQFTGDWLRHVGASEQQTRLIIECEALDKSVDNGDGNKAGRVRWANCLQGPDCDEAGNF